MRTNRSKHGFHNKQEKLLPSVFFFKLKIEHPTRESHRDPFFMVVVDVVVVASAVSGSFLSSGGSGLLTLGEQNNGQRIQIIQERHD